MNKQIDRQIYPLRWFKVYENEIYRYIWTDRQIERHKLVCDDRQIDIYLRWFKVYENETG